MVGKADGGTGALDKVATIDPNMVNDYMNRGTILAQQQLATMIAHEMGHILSPGGSVAGTARSPEEAKAISRQAEGGALSSELIVAYQLNLGSARQYSHSDSGQLTAQGAGALSVEFSLLTNYADPTNWAFDTPAAVAVVAPNSSLVQTFGAWNGQNHSSIAPKLTYDEYNAAWWALTKCGISNPNEVLWTEIQAGQATIIIGARPLLFCGKEEWKVQVADLDEIYGYSEKLKSTSNAYLVA